MADTHNKNQGGQGNQGNQGGANKGGQGNQGGAGKGGAGGSTMEKMTETAKGAMGTVTETASGMMSAAGEQAQSAVGGVASGMKTLAGTIRGQEGMLGGAAGTVADTLESGSRYLQQEGLSGIADDLTGVIRRNPLPAALVCVGIGFCLARMMTPSTSHSLSSMSGRSY